MTAPIVLVTNVEERAALAACRALSAVGFAVLGAACARPAAGLHSRSCSERLTFPHPHEDASGFVAALDDVLASRPVDVVLPGTDAALLALIEHDGLLARHSTLGLPDRSHVMQALDKVALAEAAELAGLPTPRSIAFDSVEDAAEAGRELGFPLLAKPRISVVGNTGHRRRQSAVVVRDADELESAVADTGELFLLQQLVPGSIYSCGGVVADGRLLGFCLARYRRTWPPLAGSAAYSETLEPPPGLEERVLTLVERISWEGIFELELVGSDGPRYTIDFNPRPYGSMALAVSAGANLPALWCDRLLGKDPARARARAGHRYRWEEAEIRHLVWQLTRGNLGAAASVLVPRPRTTHAVFRASDPIPALIEMLRVPRRLLAKTPRTGHPLSPSRRLDPESAKATRRP